VLGLNSHLYFYPHLPLHQRRQFLYNPSTYARPIHALSISRGSILDLKPCSSLDTLCFTPNKFLSDSRPYLIHFRHPSTACKGLLCDTTREEESGAWPLQGSVLPYAYLCSRQLLTTTRPSSQPVLLIHRTSDECCSRSKPKPSTRSTERSPVRSFQEQNRCGHGDES